MFCNNAYHFGHLFQRTVRFCEQLSTSIPNAHVYYRRGLALKRIIPQCISRDFTYLIVINEDRKVPSILYRRDSKVLLYLSITFNLLVCRCFFIKYLLSVNQPNTYMLRMDVYIPKKHGLHFVFSKLKKKHFQFYFRYRDPPFPNLMCF